MNISSAESTTLISPFCKFSENLNLMFSRALKNLDFFIVLLFQNYCYITSPSSRVIFFPPWQLANTELIGERNSYQGTRCMKLFI